LKPLRWLPFDRPRLTAKGARASEGFADRISLTEAGRAALKTSTAGFAG
jgi:hypothetical protein